MTRRPSRLLAAFTLVSLLPACTGPRNPVPVPYEPLFIQRKGAPLATKVPIVGVTAELDTGMLRFHIAAPLQEQAYWLGGMYPHFKLILRDNADQETIYVMKSHWKLLQSGASYLRPGYILQPGRQVMFCIPIRDCLRLDLTQQEKLTPEMLRTARSIRLEFSTRPAAKILPFKLQNE